MWRSHANRSTEEQKVLHWQDFSLNLPPGEEVTAAYIASLLRDLLEKHEESEFIKYLVVPSPQALSGFFRCKEADIFEALQELERQGYATECAGNLGPVLLWDPLIRRKTTRRQEPSSWHLFYNMLMPSTKKPAAS